MGIFDIDLRFNRQNWFETFSASLGTVFVRQVRFHRFIVREREWELNLDEGTITFGGEDSYDIHIIGKEDTAKRVWQWAFKDFTGVNKKSLAFAEGIFNTGKKFGNEALRENCFNLDETYNGHTLSTVACAIQTDNYCYFNCDSPTGSGAMYIAITGLPDELFEDVDVEDLMNCTLDRIKHVAVNQKIFVESFLQMNGTPYEWETRARIVADFGESKLTIDFRPANGFLNIHQMKIGASEAEKSAEDTKE